MSNYFGGKPVIRSNVEVRVTKIYIAETVSNNEVTREKIL